MSDICNYILPPARFERHAPHRQAAPRQLHGRPRQLGQAAGRGQYECYFFIADWHALTTDYADTSKILPNTSEVILDYLAAGLDPAKSVLFLQSHVLAACRTATCCSA